MGLAGAVQSVLTGFATIAIVIALGALLAHTRVLGIESQGMLARLTFYLASPALMVTVLGNTDVAQLFSANLLASLGSVVVTASAAIVLVRLVWRRSGSDSVIATFCACYVNAGNLGLPIAAYVLGNVSLIAPMLLAQLVVLQPLGLAVLDSTTNPADPGQTRAGRLRRRLGQPFRNPLMIGSGEPAVQVGTLVALKLVLQPAVAYLLGRFVVGLEGLDLLAVTVVAALPTAQNVFTHALRYRRAEILARDAIFLSTVLSVPVLVGIAGLLG
jgi:malonate transporter